MFCTAQFFSYNHDNIKHRQTPRTTRAPRVRYAFRKAMTMLPCSPTRNANINTSFRPSSSLHNHFSPAVTIKSHVASPHDLRQSSFLQWLQEPSHALHPVLSPSALNSKYTRHESMSHNISPRIFLRSCQRAKSHDASPYAWAFETDGSWKRSDEMLRTMLVYISSTLHCRRPSYSPPSVRQISKTDIIYVPCPASAPAVQKPLLATCMSSYPRLEIYSKIIAAGVMFSSLHICLERDFAGLWVGAQVHLMLDSRHRGYRFRKHINLSICSTRAYHNLQHHENSITGLSQDMTTHVRGVVHSASCRGLV
jgi:hypothetical protein